MESSELDATCGGIAPLCFRSAPAPEQEKPYELSGLECCFWFTAAVAVGGLLLVFIALANWKLDHEYGRQLLQFGGKAFIYATMAQFLVGVWFLVSLPREILMLFTGANAFATALLCSRQFSARARPY